MEAGDGEDCLGAEVVEDEGRVRAQLWPGVLAEEEWNREQA